MKVILAGFNIEAEQVKRFGGKGRKALTPEVISASYARISRDPRSIGALRREARREVEKARESNERIIFGYGHASVAEHAVFNFDVMGISRRAVEELEHFRLASFTEKSQRYIRLGRDLVVPAEIRSAGLASEFGRLTGQLHRRYEELYRRIVERGEKREVAKEDARYLMPLATSAQLGMTVNARELEYMIGRLSAHRLGELRTLAKKLSRLTRCLAPSLVRHPEPTSYYLDTRRARGAIARSVRTPRRGGPLGRAAVQLVDATPDGDARLAAALIFSSRNTTYREAYVAAADLTPEERMKIVAETLGRISPHDSVWREFEVIHLLYELVVSSSCFAQLKRHRIATVMAQPYNLGLGISVPDSIRSARAVGLFRSAAAMAESLYRRLHARVPVAAEYTLTNAHRRRVLLDVNLRELYHFSRLRSDTSAQWEIRRVSDEMCRLAASELPAGGVLLGGKDRFEEIKSAQSFINNVKC